MKNCIYRFINKENEIIYIGKAKDLKSRIKNHNHLTEECYSEVAFIEYATFDTEHEMDFAERYYIQKINPKYNIVLSDKPIQFSCSELDDCNFKIYELNEYVVERTLEQIELLKQDELFVKVNMSLISLLGVITIVNSDSYIHIRKNRDSYKVQEIKVGEKFNYYRSEIIVPKILDYEKKLQSKYHLLDINLKLFNIKKITSKINLVNNELVVNLLYKEKYKNEYKKLDFKIKCSK